jgi:hypothetical protein
MSPDGSFRGPARPPLTARVGGVALLLAAVAGAAGLAALALWLALALIPIALGAALVAWAAFRFQVWRARGRAPAGAVPAHSVGGQPDLFRRP